MSIVERYIFKTSLVAFVASLGLLTGIVWVTQALRQVDLMATKGQTLVIFLTVTGLTIPSLVMVIAPIALFIAVIFTLNKLNGDSELIVMSASGMSPSRLLRPFAALTVLVTLLVGGTSLWAMPESFRAITNLFTQIRADMLTRVVREGQFVTLDKGFVFHYRERGANGGLFGLFIQDRRDPERISTYLAEAGRTVESGAQNYLVLEKGSVQRQTKDDRDPAIVLFERYAIDLAQFGGEADGAPIRPRERSTFDLITRNQDDPYVRANEGRFRQELHDRFTNPFYAIVFGMIAFAALVQPRTTRQGRGISIAVAILVAMGLRVAGFGASAMLVKSAGAVALAYGIPLVGLLGAVLYAFGPEHATWTRWLASIRPRATATAGVRT
ncbi:MAG: LPS export ABC transporter permease LptF [Beijerinckiaceae bacterium]|nr:LPS export ABC transporter permease LptF [Beijerinckiaceae bacterium]